MPESATRDRTLREPVSPWAAWLRKARAVSTVAARSAAAPNPEELVSAARALSAEGAAAPALGRAIWTLWRVEGLVYSYCHGCGDASLREMELPLEVGPPAQCGLAMATVLATGFEPEAIATRLEARADPRFLDFAQESVGLMLAAYEPDLFGRVSALLSSLHLLRRPPIVPTEPALFFSRLPEPWQRLAAHGYGRMLYFKCHGLERTLRAIRARPFLPFGAAVRGAMSAYVLVNSRSIDSILALADTPLSNDVSEAIAGGLTNVVQLLEWSLPGSMESFDVSGSSAAQLLAAAVATATERRRRGLGPGMVA